MTYEPPTWVDKILELKEEADKDRPKMEKRAKKEAKIKLKLLLIKRRRNQLKISTINYFITLLLCAFLWFKQYILSIFCLILYLSCLGALALRNYKERILLERKLERGKNRKSS